MDARIPDLERSSFPADNKDVPEGRNHAAKRERGVPLIRPPGETQARRNEMRTRRKIWWICLAVLLLACIGLVIHTKIAHMAHRRQIQKMGATIDEDYESWKDLEIDGQHPMLFNKEMYVANGVVGISFTATMIAIGVVIVFLVASVAVARRQNRSED
jgi:hypothetical protein